MSVIEDGKTYYIQYADNQRYVSMPKTFATGTACEAVPKDEDKYYQKWHVKIERVVKRFEKACVITEATEKKFNLDVKRIETYEPVVADEGGKSWIIQDTGAKKKAADRKAARAKGTDKADATDKEDASDKEDVSDKENTSDKEEDTDKDTEAAKVTTYTVLKRQLNGGGASTTTFNWIMNGSQMVLGPGSSGHQSWKFVEA